jgi:hypothetical protein
MTPVTDYMIARPSARPEILGSTIAGVVGCGQDIGRRAQTRGASGESGGSGEKRGKRGKTELLFPPLLADAGEPHPLPMERMSLIVAER